MYVVCRLSADWVKSEGTILPGSHGLSNSEICDGAAGQRARQAADLILERDWKPDMATAQKALQSVYQRNHKCM